MGRYVLSSKEGVPLFSYPALSFSEFSSFDVLGQPPEISLLIGSFLLPKDLARAQEVNKSWYWSFGRDSLWKSHLPPLIRSSLSSPAKVDVVYQTILKNYWEQGKVEGNEVPTKCDGYRNVNEGVLSPDGRWMITFGMYGSVFRWKGMDSNRPPAVQKIAPSKIQNPHQSFGINSGAVSPDGNSLFTVGEGGYVVKWRRGKRCQFTGTAIAGRGLSIDPHSSCGIGGIALSSDGKWGMTCGSDGRVVYWEGLDGSSPVATPICGKGMASDPHYYVQKCAISSNGHWALSVGREGNIVVWKGFLNGSIHGTVVAHRDYVRDCVISLDNSWALTLGSDGSLVQWRDLEKTRPVAILLSNEKISGAFPSIALSPDSTWALLCVKNIVFIVHRLNSPAPVMRKVITLTSELFKGFIVPSIESAIIVSFSRTFSVSPTVKWAEKPIPIKNK